MKQKKQLTIAAFVCFFVVWGFLMASPLMAQSGEVLVAEIEGPVTPAMASYFERVIEDGERMGASAVLIVLNTPGGGVNTSLGIVQDFRAAEVPVIIFVAPNGAQAASAGSLITAAAHVAAMAPQTVIGAASPINGDGTDINETAYRKAVEDLKATMRGLTERRGDAAVELAESMIEDARAVTSDEALEVGFIDVIAKDVPDLLEKIDGLVVEVGGDEVTLQTAGAAQRTTDMGAIETVLHALSDPFLIGILLSIGPLAIIVEFYNPGGWVAGFVGVVCLGLALYGLGVVEANFLGLAFIVVAFILFLLELKTPTIGALAAVGTVTLVAGLLVLFNTPQTPQFARLPLPSAIGISLPTAGLFLFIITKALQAQRVQPATGSEGMIGQTGPVKKTFKPVPGRDDTYTGTVLVMGELWKATADQPLISGEEIIVRQIKGFTLTVERAYNGVNGNQPVSAVPKDSQAA